MVVGELLNFFAFSKRTHKNLIARGNIPYRSSESCPFSTSQHSVWWQMWVSEDASGEDYPLWLTLSDVRHRILMRLNNNIISAWNRYLRYRHNHHIISFVLLFVYNSLCVTCVCYPDGEHMNVRRDRKDDDDDVEALRRRVERTHENVENWKEKPIERW